MRCCGVQILRLCRVLLGIEPAELVRPLFCSRNFCNFCSRHFCNFCSRNFCNFCSRNFCNSGIFSSRLCALSLSRAWLGKPRVIAFIGASFLNKKEAVLHRAQIREWASAEGKLFVASVRTYHIETQSDRRVFHCRRERERGVVVPVGPD